MCNLVLNNCYQDMESPGDDNRGRVKFLCSYGGSILPRPHDGKLRYVGGDTRIVSVPRDITYTELLFRMQELFDGVSVIKYQQPDEDLDALVSVVNDDDVISMMEEYDKVGLGGDGCTRLRIFLFSSCMEMDVDSVAGYFDTGERESERRYVDALNSFPETKSPASPDLPEQQFGQLSVDVGIGNHVNLPHLIIPQGLRQGEMDATWNPGYYSPGGHRLAHDPREFPHSPSYHFGAGEFNDRILDDHARQAAGHQLRHYNHLSPPPVDTMMWLPVGTEKAGFPNNLGHQHSFAEGNNVCESCRMSFHRKQGVAPETRYVEPHRKHGQSYLEQPSIMNDYAPHFPNSYTHGYPSPYMVNQDLNIEHVSYMKEQREFHRAAFNETHVQSQGWVFPSHHIGQRLDDTMIHHLGTNRQNEQFIMDGNIGNNAHKYVNIHDGHEELQWFRHGNENGDENFVPKQTFGVGMYVNSPVPDEMTGQYVNQSSSHGMDSLYQVPRNLSPIPSLRRQAQVQTRPGTPHDIPSVVQNGASISGHVRYAQEGHPRIPSDRVKYDQNFPELLVQNNFIPPKVLEFEEPASFDYLHRNGGKPYVPTDSNSDQMKVFPDPSPLTLAPSDTVSSADSISQKPPLNGHDAESRVTVGENSDGIRVHSLVQIEKETVHCSIGAFNEQKHSTEIDLHVLKLAEAKGSADDLGHVNNDAACEDAEISEETLRFIPELIASAQKAVLEGAEEVIAKEQENPREEFPAHCTKEGSNESTAENVCAEVGAQSDGDGQQENLTKIEPTTAEDEALANGLQTIKNEDLEEIRALGSGTYGSVFYGKWRGCDVAIKRIKASCFAGKPSERARLIADFWKEALLMSKLHHPNIVAFYGVVRDGPDGSLATVTEFMVNGSLKQFLQKKDRTIDRRKRLIIAMDVAFGMEYLHGKNIVHFDLKCENLLVNMRDPHRPICKIGDLGLSKVKQHTLVSGGIRGTLPWMAPELLNGKSSRVSEKIDVYSFGIVMWELLTGEEPYADIRGAAIIGGIINNNLRPKVPTWCDPEWRSLMESCWSSDPEQRPSFSEISCKLRNMAAAINLK